MEGSDGAAARHPQVHFLQPDLVRYPARRLGHVEQVREVHVHLRLVEVGLALRCAAAAVEQRQEVLEEHVLIPGSASVQPCSDLEKVSNALKTRLGRTEKNSTQATKPEESVALIS